MVNKMGDGLSLEEWTEAYRQDKEKVRRQIQTMIKLYSHTGEQDKLETVKKLWIYLVAGDLNGEHKTSG